MQQRHKRLGCRLALFIAGALCAVAPARGQSPDAGKPFVIEYYYKVKWGHFDEFLRLFKKNHVPLLKREKEMGRIVAVSAVTARYHGTEDGRWDLRVTITWRDAATANDGWDPAPVTRELFPDKSTFDQEEQRRFELLLAHWDLPVRDAPLDK
jgi:hypothetical protein